MKKIWGRLRGRKVRIEKFKKTEIKTEKIPFQYSPLMEWEWVQKTPHILVRK
jgi:hypothetical protein